MKYYRIKIILFLILGLCSPNILYAFELIQNIPPRNQYFTGRLSHLNSIQKNLLKHGKVYLTGYGGLGKTQIAKEFSYVNKKKYDLVWWFDLRDDLIDQYESLLIHLSNNKKFNKLLHIKVRDIPSGAIINFTNSLLDKSNCKWLLIFDNVINNKNIKFPNSKDVGKNVLITTREKQIFGDNVLMIEPFTDQESMRFLSKIHDGESKGDIIRLYKTLHNYPLALAQVSETILVYRDGIRGYFKRFSDSKNIDTKLVSTNMDLAQKYTDDYNEVLDNAIQAMERKDKKAAEVLYMLVLLKTNMTKKLFNDLFGDKLVNKLIILNKLGLIQMDVDGKTTLLSVHDVIREKVLERFNSKGMKYKKKITQLLSCYLYKFYSEDKLQYLNSFGSTNSQITPLYSFIEEALRNNIIDERIIDMLIVALRMNDVLFNKNADYFLYQKLANKIYTKNLEAIDPLKKSLLYATLIYSDYIFSSKEKLLKFEKEFLRLISLVDYNEDKSKLFFIYTYLFKFYVMQGDLKTAKKFKKLAETNRVYVNDIFSLLQYWYTTMWFCYSSRNVNEGMRAFNIYKELIDKLSSSKIRRSVLRSYKIVFGILSRKRKKEIRKEVEEAMKETIAYYNDATSSDIGGLEFINALLYFYNDQYDLALVHCTLALGILNKNPGEMKSGYHGNIYLMLGRIYDKNGNINLALHNYKKSLEFYNKMSYGQSITVYEYGELLSALTAFYYEQNNYVKSRFYFQKLVSNFGLEHEFLRKLLGALPVKYMYKIGDIRT